MHAIVVKHRAPRVILDDEGLTQRLMTGLMTLTVVIGGACCVALMFVR